MTAFPRYAIYYTPTPGSDLERFGSQLLGYDAFSGNEIAFPDDVLKHAPDWASVTSDPRKYGFHATLKAPMGLASGRTEAELLDACAAFAATPRPIPVIQPVVGSIVGFIAVIPAAATPELMQLAADCVREFDLFRAPLSPADRARRNPAQLTPSQREHLDRWGYPHVMEDFRFHMTLTGRLDPERLALILAMLKERFAGLRLATLPIDRIALFRQVDATSRFHIIGHWKLRATET